MKASLIVIGLALATGICLAQRPDESRNGKTAQSQTSTQAQTSQSTAPKSNEKTQTTTELKTQTYKGELVDANCAAGGASSTSSAPSSKGAQPSSADRSSGKSGEANRSGESNQSCAASANTTDFGLRTKDGHVMRFDAVGNERAKEAFSARKKWSDASAAGKSIQATVSGTESGDRLTVVSIH